MKSVTKISAVAVAAGALLLAGCSADTAGSGSDAAGELTFICSPQEDWCQVVASEFTNATGINANYVRLSGGEAVARLNATGDKPEFDAWFGGGAEGHIAADEQGMIEKYVSPNADVIPENYRAADGTWTGV